MGPAAEPKRPAITIQTVEAPGVQVFHLNMPWGPETFAAMERPGEGFYNRRSWPFARMETTRALKIEDTALPAGNYALVFHPNTPEDEGMSLEVRKIAPGEFLQNGNVMTRTPEGETVWQAPVTFETGRRHAPRPRDRTHAGLGRPPARRALRGPPDAPERSRSREPRHGAVSAGRSRSAAGRRSLPPGRVAGVAVLGLVGAVRRRGVHHHAPGGGGSGTPRRR